MPRGLHAAAEGMIYEASRVQHRWTTAVFCSRHSKDEGANGRWRRRRTWVEEGQMRGVACGAAVCTSVVKGHVHASQVKGNVLCDAMQ